MRCPSCAALSSVSDAIDTAMRRDALTRMRLDGQNSGDRRFMARKA